MTGRHELPDPPEPADPAPPRSAARVVEVKVIASTAVALMASIFYAIVNAVQAQPDILNGLPPWLRFLLIAALPPLLAFLAGYQIPSNRV